MAAVIPRASEAARSTVNWPRFGALAAIVLVITLLYWPAAESLAVLWSDTERNTYTHGFAILAVCGWLLWRARADFSRERAPGDSRYAWAWLLPLAGSVLAWQLAYRAGVSIGIEVLLPAITWFAIGAVLGTRAARTAFFPLAYIVFALTLWDVINPLLQQATVHAVRLLLAVVAVPAYFEGDLVHIPAGQFEIQGGCSGLHFMIVAVAIATLMGELREDGWRRRLQWIACAVALALLVNWLRVASIIVAGHLTQMQAYIVRESHYGYGWVLFSVAMLGLFLVERRVPLAPRPAPADAPAALTTSSSRLVPVAAALLVALPLMLNLTLDRRLENWPTDPFAPPRGEWLPVAPDRSAWTPQQVNADREDRAAYSRGEERVERYVGVYREQRSGKKMGGFANRLQGEALVVDQASISIGGREYSELTLEQDGRRSLLRVAYQSGGRSFASATRAQIQYSVATLLSLRSSASRVVALWAPCGADCATARESMNRFVEDGGVQ